MQKKYRIEIDCANCARKVEEAVNKIDGVKNANINFMLGKMTVEYHDGVNVDEVFKKIKNTGERIDPDFEIK